ncbi:MAG TPA: hypothetical protein VFC78_12650 [Tepidisphaeraceae bacterium]|nr:hypothetical protein [Tepidisphaeraceae bacterium]
MQNSRWIARRAESLAYVFMTRDPRVAVVSEDDTDFGLNFMIRVGTTPRQFNWITGVEVRGIDHPPRREFLLELTEDQAVVLNHSQQPSFLLAVDVRGEILYFAWIRSPVAETKHFRATTSLHLEPLDDALFKAHIDEIRAFYRKRLPSDRNMIVSKAS